MNTNRSIYDGFKLGERVRIKRLRSNAIDKTCIGEIGTVIELSTNFYPEDLSNNVLITVRLIEMGYDIMLYPNELEYAN